MNFLNLEYFLVTAEELNFTRAAKRLYVSQQSLSKHIAKLEEHFGVQLFDRTPPLTLTPAGISLVKSAQKLISIKNEAEVELNDIKDFRSGSLSIGVTHSRGTVILPFVLPAFHRAYPHIKLNLFESGTSQELDEALLSGRVDLTIGFKPTHRSNVESDILLDEKSFLVVPNVILATYCPEINPQNRLSKKILIREILKNCPFVTISKTTWAGAMFERYCRRLDIAPTVVVETWNVATMVALSLEGMGASICPQIFLPTTLSQMPQQFSIYPLELEPEHHVIAVNYLKNKYLTQAARKFIAIVKERLHDERLLH